MTVQTPIMQRLAEVARHVRQAWFTRLDRLLCCRVSRAQARGEESHLVSASSAFRLCLAFQLCNLVLVPSAGLASVQPTEAASRQPPRTLEGIAVDTPAGRTNHYRLREDPSQRAWRQAVVSSHSSSG